MGRLSAAVSLPLFFLLSLGDEPVAWGVGFESGVSQNDAGNHQARNPGHRLESVDHKGHVAHSTSHHSLLQPKQPTKHMMRAEQALATTEHHGAADVGTPAAKPAAQPAAERKSSKHSLGHSNEQGAPSIVVSSMAEMGGSDLSLLPEVLRTFVLRKKSRPKVAAPEITCGEGAMGKCGPCFSDGVMESGDPNHPAEARMCLAGSCTKLCDVKDPKDIVENDACPKQMNLTIARFQEFQKQTCPSSACFPGVAQVQVRGRGRVPIGELRPHHDHVLVEGSAGEFVYEPVLGWLHHVPDSHASYLDVKHELGELRVSEAHLVFVDEGNCGKTEKLAANLRVGDTLYAMAQDNEGMPVVATVPMLSKVLSVVRKDGNIGMYAPLSASGTIFVDGTLASNYAGPGRGVHVPHAAAHALFFPVRAYHFITSMLALSSTDARLAETASRFLPSGVFFIKP